MYILNTCTFDTNDSLLFQSDPITPQEPWVAFHLIQRKSVSPYKGPQAYMLWYPVPSGPHLLLSPLLILFQYKSTRDVPWVFQACSHLRIFILSSFLCLERSDGSLLYFLQAVIFWVRPMMTPLYVKQFQLPNNFYATFLALPPQCLPPLMYYFIHPSIYSSIHLSIYWLGIDVFLPLPGM